jgi:uncharacterized membrane protein
MRRTAWIAMTTTAVLLAVGSLRYFSLNPLVFIPGQQAAYLANEVPLLLHIAGGTVALAVGPFQFLSGLRARRPGLHRALGRLYLAAVALTAAGGLGLARIAQGAPVARLGFAALAVVLLATTAMALAMILRHRVPAHRAWMTRSYAVVFTAVTFRLWLAVFTITGLPFDQVYAVGAWTAWMINLLIAEALLERSSLRHRQLGQRQRAASVGDPLDGAETRNVALS